MAQFSPSLFYFSVSCNKAVSKLVSSVFAATVTLGVKTSVTIFGEDFFHNITNIIQLHHSRDLISIENQAERLQVCSQMFGPKWKLQLNSNYNLLLNLSLVQFRQSSFLFVIYLTCLGPYILTIAPAQSGKCLPD